MLLAIMEYRNKFYLPNLTTRKIYETMVFRKKYSEPHRPRSLHGDSVQPAVRIGI